MGELPGAVLRACLGGAGVGEFVRLVTSAVSQAQSNFSLVYELLESVEELQLHTTISSMLSFVYFF